MPQIAKAEISHLAELARLHLTEAEIASLEADLPKILELAASLRALSVTSGDDSTAHGLQNAFRDDETDVVPVGDPGDLREAFLARDAEGNLAIPPVFSRRS